MQIKFDTDLAWIWSKHLYQEVVIQLLPWDRDVLFKAIDEMSYNTGFARQYACLVLFWALGLNGVVAAFR